MKKKLDKAPLVHTLIHLRFTEVPALTTITTELVSSLHSKMMDKGFPEKIESKAEVLEWSYDSASQQMRQKKITASRLLFRAAGEQEIVEVSDSSLVLKSTSYKTFNEFYQKFYAILLVCMETIPNLEKCLLKSVGLRYVDVIAPTQGLKLSDFVREGIQPPSLNVEGTHLQGHTLKAVKVDENQILVLNFEELPTFKNQIQKVLPDNLMEPDEKCGLVIHGQKEWFSIDSPTYGILDIDHTHQFSNSPIFDVELIQSATHSLYQSASDIFWDAITEQAKEAWGYKEIV